jgi:molecular chaperone HscB
MRHIVFGVTDRGPDYFAFFGIEPRLALDAAALQKRFYELSRQWHPDRYASRPAADQRLALENTAILNDAFRTLREPVARAEYVLSRNGLDISEQGTANVPSELLEEALDLNMALEEAEGPEELAPMRFRYAAMLGAIDGELEGLFREWDSGGGAAALQKIRGVLNRRKYISNLVQKLNKALHEHVSD